ncbi:MAG: glycosyltransferase family 4 protein [Proteobacteria bacterium]|nr:glycosyltransferase family 4 protein [Pseudomonadota bacterium]
MRIAFALSGFHRVDRGAEVALLSVADALAQTGDQVTVFGSGAPREGTAYDFRHVGAVPRERFEWLPSFPPFRDVVMWEDATFAAAFLAQYRPDQFDAVVTCAYPFTHLALRRATAGPGPLQIFVTQNGDWPAFADNAEYRLFRSDGLVCTNPDYFDRNQDRWRSALIPNGIDLARFGDGAPERGRFGLPESGPIILMVSAFIESKRVADGVRAVAGVPGAHLVVAGDGPLRDEVERLAAQLLPGRFSRVSLTAAEMPALYRSADVFLHMSLLESFGNVFLEAMASGLPVVGHDTPRLRWIVGDGQQLCDTTDRAALISALERAVQRGRGASDPRTADFAWPAIAGKYRSFLRDLHAEKTG